MTAADADRHKQTIRRLNEAVINSGDLDLLDELYAPDLRHVRRGMITTMTLLGPPPDGAGPTAPRDRFRAGYRAIHSGFPDWHSHIELLIAEADTVVSRYRVSGTNTGSFLGRPPTGRAVALDEVVYFRFEDGRVAEIWAIAAEIDLWQQLGLLPEPAALS